MRWYRRDDMDELPSPEPLFRSDEVREHVDRLPSVQRHIIERLFFGGATLLEAAEEIGVSQKHAREQKLLAFQALREAVLADHQVGSLSAAAVGSEPNRILSLARGVGSPQG